MVSNSISCDVNTEDFLDEMTNTISNTNDTNELNTVTNPIPNIEDDNTDIDSHMNYTEKMAIYSINKMIKHLHARSEVYKHTSYVDSLELNRTINFQPPLPIQIFSLSVSLSVSVSSLLNCKI